MKLALAILALLPFAVGGPAPTAAQIPARGCNFGREHAIADGSTWADQFRCYQSSGRHVSVEGTSFIEGGISGGACVRGVGADRVQIGACTGFSSNSSITISFASIKSVLDDPDSPAVTLYINR